MLNVLQKVKNNLFQKTKSQILCKKKLTQKTKSKSQTYTKWRIVTVIKHGLKPGDSVSRLVQYFNWTVSAQDLVKLDGFVGTCVTHLGL